MSAAWTRSISTPVQRMGEKDYYTLSTCESLLELLLPHTLPAFPRTAHKHWCVGGHTVLQDHPFNGATWLGGSWVVISRVISRVTILITHIRGLITPLITSHEPPSIHSQHPKPQGPNLLTLIPRRLETLGANTDDAGTLENDCGDHVATCGVCSPCGLGGAGGGVLGFRFWGPYGLERVFQNWCKLLRTIRRSATHAQ